MNRRIALMALLILFGAAPDAGAQAARQKTFEEMVNTPVVVKLPRMDQVRVIADQSYASAKDPRLLMDVYLPPDLKAGERRSVVVFVHGGTGSGTRPKDWGIYRSWGRLAAEGPLVGKVDARLEGRFGVHFLGEDASGFDEDRVIQEDKRLQRGV